MPQDIPNNSSDNDFALNIYPVGDAFYKPAARNDADTTTKRITMKRRKPHKVIFRYSILAISCFLISVSRFEQHEISTALFNSVIPLSSWCYLAF